MAKGLRLDFTGPFVTLADPPSAEAVAERYAKGYYTTAWLAKEQVEHRRGLWDAPYQHRAALMGWPGKLLDYGCGAGHFVAWYNRCEGCRAWGYDPYPFESWERVSPVVFKDRHVVDAIAQTLEGYDAVHLSLVLEHVPDPVGFLRGFRERYLLPGGKLLVIVPNEFNPLQRRLEKRWGPWYIAEDHLNYWEPDTLAWALGAAGYDVKHMGSTFPTELFAGLGDYRDTRLGTVCFRALLIFQRIVGPRCFGWYKKAFDRWGIGRELICLAQAR